MPINFSTLSPEEELALERPSLFGRLLATIAEPGNYIGNRAVSGLHQLGSALYNAATGKSASEIVSRLNEIDAERRAEDRRRHDYIRGKSGSSLPLTDHALNALGVIFPAASSTKSLARGLTRKALASNAARNKIIEAENIARAAGENLPRAWRGMSNSELIDVARDNAVREAWLNRLARQDIESILPNFGRTSVKTQLLGGLGNALGGFMSDLPYNAEAEARLAEVALSEPTSLKPTSTETAVPAMTATSTDDTMDDSRAGTYNLYPSEPTDVVSDGLSYNDDGTAPLSPLLAEYQKTLRQTTEENKKALEGLKKDYENLRNIQAIDPYQWETRVQLERQLLDAEKRASNNYRDDPWNTIGAILTAPLTARRLENPFEVWERNVQGAVDRDPEVRRLRRLLGYTNDLPSGSDRAKSEQSVIERVSKVNFDLLNASLNEQQKLIEAAMTFNSHVSEERKKKAEEEYKRAQAEAARARAKYYEEGGYRGFDPTAISSLLNQGAIGASPFKENN